MKKKLVHLKYETKLKILDGCDFRTTENRIYNNNNGYSSYHFEECNNCDNTAITETTTFLFNIVILFFIFGDGDISIDKNFTSYFGSLSNPKLYDYCGKNSYRI
ncbi:hypothetical protein H8356DRAFT_1419757 [Neocallimastix lanati (nom. inval.)]|nr:hypothetical protein H8356DRAFT_1419757 [Neocallimastix sp. JGI-2020a]